MAYQFTPAHPPLLKENNGNIFDIDPTQLQRFVGEATWDSAPTAGAGGATVVTTFHMVRTWTWVISIMPKHFATTEKYKLTYKSSYKKTDRETMEKTIGGDAKASFLGIGLSVSASLKLTSEQTQEWQEETDNEVEFEFEAGSTYCGWTLVDTLDLTAETKSTTPGAQPATTVTSTRNVLSAPISIYNDVAADANQQIATNARASFNALSSQFDMESMRKTLPALDKDLGFRHGTTDLK
jgi:hypothetical protein